MRKYFVVFIVLLCFGLGACVSNQNRDAAHNSQNSLDWAGTYTGVIPSASGMGINVRITLNADETYEVSYQYTKAPDEMYTGTGKFSWDKTGSVITLDTSGFAPYYKVGENCLIQLDMQKKRITGKLADEYVLAKTSRPD